MSDIGISRPDLWKTAVEIEGSPQGVFGTYKVWSVYWRLLRAVEGNIKIRCTESMGGLGWDGGSHTEDINPERFLKLYGASSLLDLLEHGKTGDCVGSNRSMHAEII